MVLKNILHVVGDDAGIEHFPGFGRGGAPGAISQPTLPNLVNFFAGSVGHPTLRFDRFYATQFCTPTRVCLHTSRWPFETGMGNLAQNDFGHPGVLWPMQLGEVGFPQALAGGGRRFAFIGKWHMSSTDTGEPIAPERHGWHHFAGHMRNWSSPQGYYNHSVTVNGEQRPSTWFLTRAQTDLAIDWIRQQGSAPWFLMLNYFAPHTPNTLANTPPTTHYDTAAWGVPPIGVAAHANKAHLEAQDFELGRLLARINLDDTLVVYHTDNGSPFATLGLEGMSIGGVTTFYDGSHGKDSPYEPGIVVPAMMRGAGVVQGASRTTSALSHVVDFLPTYADLLGLSPTLPEGVTWRGRSLRALAEGTASTNHTEVWTEHFIPNGINYGTTPGDRALIEDRYKLMRRNSDAFAQGSVEFYDLKPNGVDYNPMEVTNLTPGGVLTGLSAGQRAKYNELDAKWRALLVEPT